MISQRRFDGWAFLLPFLQRNTLIAELPHRDTGIILVTMLAEQIRRHPRMVYEADTLKLVFRRPSAEGIEQEHQQHRSTRQQIGKQGVFHRGLEQRREQRDIPS